MKTACVVSLTLLLARAVAFSGHGSVSEASAPASAAASPAPAAATLPALRLEFEIKNYNYFDLTKEQCPQQQKQSKAKSKDSKSSGKGDSKKAHSKEKSGDDAGETVDELEAHADKVHKDIGEHVDKMQEAVPKVPMPWTEKESLLEAGESVTKCQTVGDVFRAAIEDTVRGLMQDMLEQPPVAAPAPAPAPALFAASAPAHLVPLPKQSASFLGRQGAAAPAPAAVQIAAPSPAVVGPKPGIFVTFAPGQDVGHGAKSIIVKVTFTDAPNNGLDDLAITRDLVQQAVDNGLLRRHIKEALHMATGIKPKLSKAVVKHKTIEQWDVKKCEGHIRGIVAQFSKHYTREQVPMALYNECTNFVTKISFSNDHVLDPQDTAMCRKTTAKFAKHWNFGQKAKDDDFELMCVRSCEAKFGKNAPQCHVQTGDGLIGQPL